MKRLSISAVSSLVTLWVMLMASPAALAQLDAKLFTGMKARSIGPAGMSGRIGAIEAVASDPNIIYVGAATGGVWKSTGGGVRWKPIFDDQPVSSIGAIAVFQPNPSIVWVGTGEGNPRNSSGVGNGVYKSLDGGQTWTHLGLDKTEKIPRLILHPTNPDIAYLAALGTTWGENPERGVFKTTDGGQTWKKILYVDEKTGCADLVMDPQNPDKLFAAMWQHRRWPWFFKSGGPGSGLYVTDDGGDNWKRLGQEDGLPKGELGRIGLGIARSHPNIVYALVEARKSALCRSDDGGRRWRIVNKSPNVNPRPFYYADIRVDPVNENRVYSLQSILRVSNDGGKSFRPLLPFSRVHPDHHALWVHPQHGRLLIDGSDGGVAISRDGGDSWRFVEDLPLAQFYHINVDMERPFNIYGGMQDNGSWRGPSQLWENGGIRNYHWEEVGFGDGFATLTDPSDPHFGYSMSQGGNLRRFNRITGERKDIRPPQPDDVKLRFNWNAGIASHPFDPKTIYYGSQFVHQSADRGETWTIISPDLTTNDGEKQKQDESGGLTRDVTAAENYTTILTIAPSPVRRGVIWVGTDDGNLQVTRNGGETWTNVSGRIPGLPAGTWCPHIEASKFAAGTAFAVFDDHRRSNWKTYIYKTEDFGRSWVSLAKNRPTNGAKPSLWGFAQVIEQDPVNKNLLYLGTEFGLYISFDGGDGWMKWTGGLPTVPVRALTVHPRDHALVIGTHGRAAYVLDDVRPLRQISQQILEEPLHLFAIAPVYQHRIKQVGGYRFPADGMFRGENRPYGALITYSLNLPQEEGQPADENEKEEDTDNTSDKKKRVIIEILDASGKVIRKMKGPRERGLNRVAWNLRRDRFKRPPRTERRGGRAPSGPEVLPGDYTVRIKIGQQEASQPVKVLPDPRVNLSMTARRKKSDTIMRVGQRIEVITEAVRRLNQTSKMIEMVMDQIKDRKDEKARQIKTSGRDLKKSLAKVSDRLVDPPGRQGIYPRNRAAINKLQSLAGSLASSFDAPTEAQLTTLRQAEAFLDDALKQFNKLFAEDVAAFRRKVSSADVALFPKQEPLNANWKPKREK